MMVPVQENERLLSQHNEYCVAKFGQFGEHKQPGPETADAILFDVAVNIIKSGNILIFSYS